VLSLTGVKEGLRGHVVVEMCDLDNEPLVKLVGGELIETVVAHDVIGRLMIQCALQPGLAQVFL
jgi:ion channel POLLUX/CASTOR